MKDNKKGAAESYQEIWRFNSRENEVVNSSLMVALKDQQLPHDENILRRSIQRYFEHLKRDEKEYGTFEVEDIKRKRRRNSRRSRRTKAYLEETEWTDVFILLQVQAY